MLALANKTAYVETARLKAHHCILRVVLNPGDVRCNKTSNKYDTAPVLFLWVYRRRSSVNFGGKTFLPENICMKN